MRCRIVKILNLSGEKTSVYSVFVDDAVTTLFERFISENKDLFKGEILLSDQSNDFIGTLTFNTDEEEY